MNLSRVQRFIRDHLAAADQDQDDSRRPRLAAAALMIETARADNRIDQRELEAIASRLRTLFDLDKDGAEALIKLARERVSDSAGLDEFTSALNNHYDLPEKVKLIEDMWRIAFTDGQADEFEQHLLSKVASLLYVPHNDYIAAKLRARKQGWPAPGTGN